MTPEYLVFLSSGWDFAIPASLVVHIRRTPPPLCVSFSEAVLCSREPEDWSVLLESGVWLSVADVFEIRPLAGTLPLPGYIFASDTDWIRGVCWEEKGPILILNDQRLYSMVEGHVSDIHD
jgi:hypothetical protein